MQIKKILTTTVILLIWGLGFSQNSISRFDIQVENESIIVALEKLSKISGKQISFSSNYFQGVSPVQIDLKQVSLDEALETILQGTAVTFRRVSGQIVLVPKEKKRFTLSGYIKDVASGERLPTALVYLPSKERGTVANEYGFFSIELEEGAQELVFDFLGYSNKKMTINIKEDSHQNIELKTNTTLSEVIVYPEERAQIEMTAPNAALEMSPQFIKSQTSIGGEDDVIRAVQILPGVQSGIDGFGGLRIRGGNTGQNLMLMDGVPVYIPYHLMGLYSVYNTSTIQSAKLLKGSIPARYGGATAAIFDIRIKEGNANKWTAEAGVNLTLGKAIVEGPLFKGKGGFILSGRMAHSDFLMKPVLERLYFEDSGGINENLFYDFNAKFNYTFSDKDRIYLSYFQGNDALKKEDELSEEEEEDDDYANTLEMLWQNRIISFRWNRLYNERLFSNLTLTYSAAYSSYSRLDEFSTEQEGSDYVLRDFLFLDNRTNVKDIGLKWDFDYLPSAAHSMRFGIGISAKDLYSELTYIEENFIEDDDNEYSDLDDYQELLNESGTYVFENYAYLESNHQLTSKVDLNLGLRISNFINEETYFWSLEPRIYLGYRPNTRWRFHASIGRMVQYLHLVNSSSLSMPSDLWLASDPLILPQVAWESEIGIAYKALPSLSLQVQVYKKAMEHIYTYPENFNFLDELDEKDLTESLLEGNGASEGVEFLATYELEKTNFLASYTLSETTRQYDGINDGEVYPDIYDHRHQFKFSLSQRLIPGLYLDINAVYLSANPLILLANVDSENGFSRLVSNPQSTKNEERYDAYKRLDLAMRYRFEKVGFKHSFKLGLYNALNLGNIAYYRYDLEDENTIYGVNAIQVIPSFSYSIQF